MTMANVTDLVLTWSDPFEVFNDYLWIKIIQVAVPTLVLIIGTVLLLGMISYEKYGEDPQKRGLFNQLLSQLFTITVLAYWVIIPVRIIRLLTGPLNLVLYWIWAFSLNCFIYSANLYIAEYFLMKFISIVVKKQVLPFLEDFFGFFLAVFNFVISVWLLVISSFTQDFAIEQFKARGLPDFLGDMTTLLSWR